MSWIDEVKARCEAATDELDEIRAYVDNHPALRESYGALCCCDVCSARHRVATLLKMLDAARTDLPAALELIEEAEKLIRRVSEDSEHVDCDGPGCWWCGPGDGGEHKDCPGDAFLAKVRRRA